MSKLKDYKIEFYRVPLFGWWSFKITTPDKRELLPLFSGYVDRTKAEEAALRRIEIDMSRSSVNGEELAQKVKSP
jgi:hypothetical protein